MSSFIIQSHRGAGKLGPENTLESFETAWRIGTVPEADVRATRDGVIVAFHDDNFERLAKDPPAEIIRLDIGRLDWEQIAELDVGSYKGPEFAGQKIPRIADVFERMRGKPERVLYLDVKEVPLERLAAMAREYAVTRQLILASTIYEHLVEWKRLLPESQTLHWMGGSEERLRERINRLRKADFAAITQLQIHVNVGDPQASDPFAPSSEFLRSTADELKAHGILFQALPWGFYSVEVYHKLMDLGVESFATDDPEVALAAMRTYSG